MVEERSEMFGSQRLTGYWVRVKDGNRNLVWFNRDSYIIWIAKRNIRGFGLYVMSSKSALIYKFDKKNLDI